MNLHYIKSVVAVCLPLIVSTTWGISIDFVSVGNPGNQPDTRHNGIAVGSLAHLYQPGKFKITVGQYCEFLNAVAATDTHGLYGVVLLGCVVAFRRARAE